MTSPDYGPERNTFCPDQAVKVGHPDGMLSVRSVKLFAGKKR